jgi:hypothetical protein
MSYGHYMMHNLPVQYGNKVCNTVSPVDDSMSHGSAIVYMTFSHGIYWQRCAALCEGGSKVMKTWRQ